MNLAQYILCIPVVGFLVVGCKSSSDSNSLKEMENAPVVAGDSTQTVDKVALLKSLEGEPEYATAKTVLGQIFPNREAAEANLTGCTVYADKDDGVLVIIRKATAPANGTLVSFALLPKEKIYQPYELGDRLSIPPKRKTELKVTKADGEASYVLEYLSYSFYSEWLNSYMTATRMKVVFDAAGNASSSSIWTSTSAQSNFTGIFGRWTEPKLVAECTR